MYIQIWMQIRASREVDSASPVFMPSAFGSLEIGGYWAWRTGILGYFESRSLWERHCVVLLSKHSSTKGVFECQAWLWVS